MKIVQVINSLASGGAEVFTSQLAVELARQGNDVTLLTYAGVLDNKGKDLEKFLIENNVNVFHFNRKSNGFINKFINPYFFLKKRINEIQPDIIHAHLQLSDIYVSLINLQSFKKYKIFRTIHNSRGLTRFPDIIDKLLFASYNANIACSEYVRDNYKISSLRPKLISIPNGIDLTLIDNIKESKSIIRSNLNLPNDKTIFINIGRMNGIPPNNISLKNQDFIIDSLKKFKDDNRILFLFIGDGPLRKSFEEKVDTIGLNHIIKFTGSVTSPYHYIKAADICVMPSINEGLPISLIECVCSGLFSITSNIEAFKPFDTSSVYKLKEFSKKELSNQILNVLDNKELYIKLGDDNISYYRDKFHIKYVANKYLTVFNT